MNVSPNRVPAQRTVSPQAPVTAQAVAEKLKAEGESEVARGEQLQRDGVELQGRGGELYETGRATVESGRQAKQHGEQQIEQGRAQKSEGQERVITGLETETVARESEAGHAEAFGSQLDVAAQSRVNADGAVSDLKGALFQESEAHEAEAELLWKYDADLKVAAIVREGSENLQKGVGVTLGIEKQAAQEAREAFGVYGEALDLKAEGRSLQGAGQGDLRVSDELKEQSQNATNRARGYADRAAGHQQEASALREEVASHSEAAGVYKNEAGAADVLGQVAGSQADDQAAVAALLAAKAAIDMSAAESLSSLSQFSDEAARTHGEGLLADTQSVQYAERGKFYGSVSEGLLDEAGQLRGQADLETQQSGRKDKQASNRDTLGTGDARRSEKFATDAARLADQSGQVRERGEQRIAEGQELHNVGAETLQQALGSLAESTNTQEMAQEHQEKALKDGFEFLAGVQERTIGRREELLSELEANGQVQNEAIAEQNRALGVLRDEQATGEASRLERLDAMGGLIVDGHTISGAIDDQGSGFAQRTEGAATEKAGAGLVRDGEALVDKGSAAVSEGERLTEVGRQKSQAGEVIAEKGRQYQEIAEQAAGLGYNIAE